MAIVIEKFRGCKDGESKVTLFSEGDEVSGNLADIAVKNGWAEPNKQNTEKTESLPTKRKNKDGK